MLFPSLVETILLFSITSSVIPLSFKNLRPALLSLPNLSLFGKEYSFLFILYNVFLLTLPLQPHLWQLYTPLSVLIDRQVSFQFSLPRLKQRGHFTFCCTPLLLTSMPRFKNSLTIIVYNFVLYLLNLFYFL